MFPVHSEPLHRPSDDLDPIIVVLFFAAWLVRSYAVRSRCVVFAALAIPVSVVVVRHDLVGETR